MASYELILDWKKPPLLQKCKYKNDTEMQIQQHGQLKQSPTWNYGMRNLMTNQVQHNQLFSLAALSRI